MYAILEVIAHQPHYPKGLTIMTSIADKLMDEFAAIRQAAATEGNATRLNVFSQAEGVVNTVAHAGTDEQIVRHCAKVFMERMQDEDYSRDERSNYADAVFFTNVIALGSGINMNLWGPTRYC
jgi:hypothetical protein